MISFANASRSVIQVSVHFTKVALGIFEQFDWTIVQHPNNLAAGVKDGLRTSIVARAPTDNWYINNLYPYYEYMSPSKLFPVSKIVDYDWF